MVRKIRKVAVITGTRAEYGLLKPVMRAIKAHPDLRLCTLVTGMHLSREFGETYREIEKDSFKIHKKVDMLVASDSSGAMAKSVGLGIIGLTQALEEVKPVFTLVLGDRVEAFAGAVAASFLKSIVGHIHGGDKAKGGYDDYMRHAITKMAHLHFCVSLQSAQRVIRLGEEKKFVFNVGAPGLDTILHHPETSWYELIKKYKLDNKGQFAVMVQHSVSTQGEAARMQVRQTLKALKRTQLRTLVIYPNSDAGGRSIIEELKNWKNVPAFSFYKSLPREDYIGLLRKASFLIGNSSSGMIESTSLSLPVINIGIRQQGRECGENVLHSPHNENIIFALVQKCLYDKEFSGIVKKAKNPYGRGKAGNKIATILSRIKEPSRLLLKQITY
ncbi:UDP-N-acetylglucosamine 2-epimerase [Candidatus Riflebacteria bacterium]